MGFDPDTYLAEKQGGFDPDAYLSEKGVNVPRETVPEQMRQTQVAQPVKDAPEGIDSFIDNSITRAFAEFGAGTAEGFNKAGDFFLTDPANAALELAGSDFRFGGFADDPALNRQIMEPGLARDVVRKSGELIAPGMIGGQMFRTAAQTIPAVQLGGQSVKQGVIGQMGASTASQDIAYSALAGAGSEVGKETGVPGGELIGAFVAPLAGATAKNSITSIVKAGQRGIQALLKPLAGVSDDGASTLMAEAMVREGLTPEQVIKKLNDLGPEAIPADLGNNFARLLRTASNKIPRIEGSAAEVFKARQSGQGNRILNSLDDATGTSGLSVDDEIARLNAVMKPKINELYKQTGAKGIQLSERLTKLINGKNSLGKAQKKVQQRLADKRAAGDDISNIDVIDATKQQMDDQIGAAIRKGESNKARDLIRLKNIMVKEADESIPSYKEARDMYAGKAGMENAAKAGESFTKLKARDMKDLTKTYGEAEKKMFKLGAKQSIQDKIDDLRNNANAVDRLFGKNGDIKKLRYLFDDNQAFKRFEETLQRESDFALTRRAAQANSTTTKQLSDDTSAYETLSAAADSVATPTGAVSTVKRIISGLNKSRADADYTKALEDVGDLLLIKGIEPSRIQAILKKGHSKQIEAALKRALRKPTPKKWASASTSAGASLLDQIEQPEQ